MREGCAARWRRGVADHRGGFDPERANVYETLFTVGNGTLGTRGTLEEGHLGDLSGTFLSGVYDAHDVPVIDLVNAPDWLSLAVFVDGVRLDVADVHGASTTSAPSTCAHGLLYRRTVFDDADGRRTRLETLRCASFADRRLCALRVEITPVEPRRARSACESALDGRRRNLERLPVYPEGTRFPLETRWEKWALTSHLSSGPSAEQADVVYLEMRTIDSGITSGYARGDCSPRRSRRAAVVQRSDEQIAGAPRSPSAVARRCGWTSWCASARHATSTDDVADLAASTVLDAATRTAGFDVSRRRPAARCGRSCGRDCDCAIDGDPDGTRAVRFGLYHLLIAANDDDPTVNIGAKSLSGEGYRGHVFWDTEILMLPFFVYTQPDTARSLLALPPPHAARRARELARDNGIARCALPVGVGRHRPRGVPELTVGRRQPVLDPRRGDPRLRRRRATGSAPTSRPPATATFLQEFGAEILFETSRFWVDRATYDPATDRYSSSR